MTPLQRTLTLLAWAAFCTAASAASAPAPGKFLGLAMQDGNAEIALCRMALQKSTNPAVKSFAETMIEDHSSINDAIARLARSKHYKLPDGVSLKQKASYELLRARNGTGFDKAFMEHNVSDHEQDIKDFTEEAEGATDADVKSFALTTLKILREHLEMSSQVNSAIATAGR